MNYLQTEYNSCILLFLADPLLLLTYQIFYVWQLGIQCQRKPQLQHIGLFIVSLATDYIFTYVGFQVPYVNFIKLGYLIA